jgi:rare lipoprotein A
MSSKPMPAPPDTATKPAEPSASKRGGYYLDDGPGDNPPANIDAIPDAVPRAEPLLDRANRPYMALGEKYTPMTRFTPYRAQGVASWYGRRYHNNKTSSGEVYDMYSMTAAHPTLPIPSYVRVTNPENGRSVVVRVNDRGPFKKERLIDLSYAAAYKLRLTEKGSGMVVVEAINNSAFADSVQAAEASPVSVAQNPSEAARSAPALFVQVGAFRQRENADELRVRVQQQPAAQNVAVENWYTGDLYRVRLGPFASRADAERTAESLERALGISTYLIIQ